MDFKTAILNKAILSANAEYLIFSDGDCIPYKDCVGDLLARQTAIEGIEARPPHVAHDPHSKNKVFTPVRPHAPKRPKRPSNIKTGVPFMAKFLDTNGAIAYLFEVHGFDRTEPTMRRLFTRVQGLRGDIPTRWATTSPTPTADLAPWVSSQRKRRTPAPASYDAKWGRAQGPPVHGEG